MYKRQVIESLDPLPGAIEFLDHLLPDHELIILSDTFLEFARPLMRKLKFPTLFCHELKTVDDVIVDIQLRLPDHKRKSVQYLQKLNFEVVASGDSYNDLGMLKTADYCALFNPPTPLALEYPDMKVVNDYSKLLNFINNPVS